MQSMFIKVEKNSMTCKRRKIEHKKKNDIQVRKAAIRRHVTTKHQERPAYVCIKFGKEYTIENEKELHKFCFGYKQALQSPLKKSTRWECFGAEDVQVMQSPSGKLCENQSRWQPEQKTQAKINVHNCTFRKSV